MDRNEPLPDKERSPKEPAQPEQPDKEAHPDVKIAQPNPPRTTKDGITSPKFGSAGSGGAEFEPGPEKD